MDNKEAMDKITSFDDNEVIQGLKALEIIGKLRNVCTGLFPEKGDTFDLIYRPRFLRLIDEVYEKK